MRTAKLGPSKISLAGQDRVVGVHALWANVDDLAKCGLERGRTQDPVKSSNAVVWSEESG